jgi:hypothetical protein
MTERLPGAAAIQYDIFEPGNPDHKRRSYNDVVNLAEVLKLITGEHNAVSRTQEFMQILKVIFDSVVGERLANEAMLCRRYRHRYREDPDPNLVSAVVRELDQAGWVHKTRTGLMVSELGIRYYIQLVVVLSTALAFHSKDPLEQKLYLAELFGLQIQLQQRTGVAAHAQIQGLCVAVRAAAQELDKNLRIYLRGGEATRRIEDICAQLSQILLTFRDIIDNAAQIETLVDHRFILTEAQATYYEAQRICDTTVTEALRVSRLLNDSIRYTDMDDKVFHDALVREIQREFAREEGDLSPLEALLGAVEHEELTNGEIRTVGWLVSKVPGAVAADDWGQVEAQWENLFDDQGQAVPIKKDSTTNLDELEPIRMTAKEIEQLEQLGEERYETEEVEQELGILLRYLQPLAGQRKPLNELIRGSPLPDRHGASLMLDFISEFGRQGWLHYGAAGQDPGLTNQEWIFSTGYPNDAVSDRGELTGNEWIWIPTAHRLSDLLELMMSADEQAPAPEKEE